MKVWINLSIAGYFFAFILLCSLCVRSLFSMHILRCCFSIWTTYVFLYVYVYRFAFFTYQSKALQDRLGRLEHLETGKKKNIVTLGKRKVFACLSTYLDHFQ